MFQRAATAPPPPVRTRWNFHISAGEEENLGDGGEEQQAKADPWEDGHNGKGGRRRSQTRRIVTSTRSNRKDRDSG